MKRKFKLLITSVGSFVGQNILDVLEYAGFYRRDLVFVVGTNSLVTSPNLYRCNRSFLVSETTSAEFISQISKIIEQEKPDLILCGRDDETEKIVSYCETNGLENLIVYGKSSVLKIAFNKFGTALFCEKHCLPFGITYCPEREYSNERLKAFASSVGFPLVAKPLNGYASKGVFFIQEFKELKSKQFRKGYIFQEYLGSLEGLHSYFSQMNGPVPLFASAPNVIHYSAHTIILKDGTIDSVFISRNEHRAGLTVGFEKVDNIELEELAIRFGKALFSEGGFGPVTIQFRQDRNGIWKAQEINHRTNGNTFTRFLMGQDEIGVLFRQTKRGKDFPLLKETIVSSPDSFVKLPTCFVVKRKDQNRLLKFGKWSCS